MGRLLSERTGERSEFVSVNEVILMATALPPGPRDWTYALSQLRKMKQDILGYYTDLHRRYGDVVYLRLGLYQTYAPGA